MVSSIGVSVLEGVDMGTLVMVCRGYIGPACIRFRARVEAKP